MFYRTLKIRIRGRDDAPFSMNDLKEGMFETLRRLRPYGRYRVKRATFDLVIIDEHGEEVSLTKSGEWSVFPYECAADKTDPL